MQRSTTGPNGAHDWLVADYGTVFIGGNFLYVYSFPGSVETYDATGYLGCANLSCNPLWSTQSGFNAGLIANGLLYAGGATASNKGEVLVYGLP